MRKQNVGIAPGTTVLHIGPTGDFGAIPSAMQMSIESGVRATFQPANAPLQIRPAFAGLGTSVPTDFDKAKIYGYLPNTTGWLPGHPVVLSDGEPIPEPPPTQTPSGQMIQNSTWDLLSTVEKGAVVLGGALTAVGAVLAFMNKHRPAKIVLSLGATAGTIVLAYAGSHMVKAREVLAQATSGDTDTAIQIAFEKESRAEGFDLLGGTILVSGVITALLMLGKD